MDEGTFPQHPECCITSATPAVTPLWTIEHLALALVEPLGNPSARTFLLPERALLLDTLASTETRLRDAGICEAPVLGGFST
jgi:hypothetical protein